ncbi:hypothetical protein D3C79_921790 [compost metagenome]
MNSGHTPLTGGIFTKANQRLSDPTPGCAREDRHVLQQEIPILDIEHNKAQEPGLVVPQNIDRSSRYLRDEIGDHRGWLAPDQWHITSVGLFGAISNFGFVTRFG